MNSSSLLGHPLHTRSCASNKRLSWNLAAASMSLTACAAIPASKRRYGSPVGRIRNSVGNSIILPLGLLNPLNRPHTDYPLVSALNHPLDHPHERPALRSQDSRRRIRDMLSRPRLLRPRPIVPAEHPLHSLLYSLLTPVLATSGRLFHITRSYPLRWHIQYRQSRRHNPGRHAHRSVCPRPLRTAVRQFNNGSRRFPRLNDTLQRLR